MSRQANSSFARFESQTKPNSTTLIELSHVARIAIATNTIALILKCTFGRVFLSICVAIAFTLVLQVTFDPPKTRNFISHTNAGVAQIKRRKAFPLVVIGTTVVAKTCVATDTYSTKTEDYQKKNTTNKLFEVRCPPRNNRMLRNHRLFPLVH